MSSCKDCLHVDVCCSYLYIAYNKLKLATPDFKLLKNIECDECQHFKDRSHFVELPTARKIKHTPDIDKMREFHKLGLVNGMSERSIFWTCSKCELWVSLAHNFCPNCGAKFETE